MQDLLALKRYETPGDEYFDSFVDNFHRRQRQELMASREKAGLGQKLQTLFSQLGWGKALLGAGAAYAAVAVFISVSGVDQNQVVDHPLSGNLAADSVPVSLEVDRPVNFAPTQNSEPQMQLEEVLPARQEF